VVTYPSVVAKALANQLFHVLSELPGIREVWLTNDRSESIFWVIADQLSNEAERAFYDATNVLYDQHLSAPWDLHLLNSVHYPPNHDLRQSLPAGARLLKSFRLE
jgi:hypothetical protein